MKTFMYITLGGGVVTLALHDFSGYMEIGGAFCSPYDSFSKKIGRALAEDRIKAAEGFYLLVKRNSDKPKVQARELVNFVIRNSYNVSTHSIYDELGMEVATMILETEVAEEIDGVGSVLMYENIVPTWAKHGVLKFEG